MNQDIFFRVCIEGGLPSALIDGLRKLKGLPFKPSQLMEFKNHEMESMAGWIGLASWIGHTNDCQLWDADCLLLQQGGSGL